MSELRFVKIIKNDLTDITFRIEDVPAGLTIKKVNDRAQAINRTQSGVLVKQTLRYNKKSFDLTGVLYRIELNDFLQSLHESGEEARLIIFYIDGDLYKKGVVRLRTEKKEFDDFVHMLNYESSRDFINNSWTISGSFTEV